ncbi:MAG: alanine racemase [Pseudomonadota bacterium]
MLTGRLTIDLGAIADNWRDLDALTAPDCETGAVVKADAYGCGIERVGPVLTRAGCRCFFVATPEEGGRLRGAIGPEPRIHILAGYATGEEGDFRTYDLRPVLNALHQVKAWMSGPAGPAILQLDTGMNRLGLEAADLAALGPLPDCITHAMSHLACADVEGHPQTAAQLAAFHAMTGGHDTRLSLAATAGLLLGPDYHFALTRPGIGLYGGWPFTEARRVVTAEVPILQIRSVSAGESVGYGAAWIAPRECRIATICAGYADGLIRAMGSGGACAFFGAHRLPFAGRVSMDLISLDVTDAPGIGHGDWVEILGPHQSVDDLAAATGTIGHEILTSLGARYKRTYV